MHSAQHGQSYFNRGVNMIEQEHNVQLLILLDLFDILEAFHMKHEYAREGLDWHPAKKKALTDMSKCRFTSTARV